MSQHPTLRVDSVGAKHRNVLKRYERVQKMQEQSKWEDRASAFNLPKMKSMKIKVKKVKETPEEAAAAGTGVPGASVAAGAAKPAAGVAAKPAAGAKAAPAGKAADKKK